MPRLFAILVLFLLLTAVGVFGADWWLAAPQGAQSTYVGRQTCQQCHAAQEKLWRGSPHDRALDLATPETVLGDFNDREFTHLGLTSKMFRRGDKFFVNTDGPDGKLADFQIKYVIGVNPLQQYMVEFPDGRVQVLRLSWDVKRRQWFYAYPPDVQDERLKPDDPLHWTNIGSNWNHMCAECHSTNLQKNFDVASNTYHTTFAEIDVSCETCHGPGSIHVAAASRHWPFWDLNHGMGLPHLKSDTSKNQIEACAQCHSRRHAVHPDWRPGTELLDSYAPNLLESRLYHADGQILDEDYEYGSFLQSKMHAKGIRCTDCHDPHSTELLHTGNATCTSCHQHPAAKYDSPSHHHHKVGSSGASCVNCHMPVTYYMVVDPRRDHSLRIPRPDMSVKIGTPNACTGCHLELEKSGKALSDVVRWTPPQDLVPAPANGAPVQAAHDKAPAKPAHQPVYPQYYAEYFQKAAAGDKKLAADIHRLNDWSLKAVDRWYGPHHDQLPHWAWAFDAAHKVQPEAEQALSDMLRRGEYPAIVRASAIGELSRIDGPLATEAMFKALNDPDAAVRAAAASAVAIRNTSEDARVKLLAPMLNDPVRLVRLEAARGLIAARDKLSDTQKKAFQQAIEEYREGQLADKDQAPAQTNLGSLSRALGDQAAAEKYYLTAMRLDPKFFTSQFYLAELYTLQGKSDQAEKMLRGIIERAHTVTDPQHLLNPMFIEAHHKLGLLINETPARAAEAEKEFLTALKIEPRDVDLLFTLATFYLQQGKLDKAQRYAEQLTTIAPDNDQFARLLQLIQQQKAGPQPGAQP